MIWQDIVLTVGCFILALSTLPSVLSKDKPPRKMCAGYVGVLTAFAIAFATLGLTLSSIGAGAQVLVWFIVLFQKRR